MPTRILVAGGPAALPGLLAAEPDLELAGLAASLDQLARVADQLRPDVILLDVRLPGVAGMAGAAALSRAWPRARLLLLAERDEAEPVCAAIAAGASGCVVSREPHTILAAVRSAARGYLCIPPRTLRALVARLLARERSARYG